MKHILLSSFICFVVFSAFANTKTVTPTTYEAVYNSAMDGDVLLLESGTYATALNFPVGKAITLQKSPTASTMPVLNFSWTTNVVPTAGSSLTLDGLDLNLGAQYFIQFAAESNVDKFIVKNCVITNISRSFIRATNAGIRMNELLFENCIIKDCGADGFCFVWFREVLNKYTVRNNTMYNYGGEGFFLAQNNDQSHTFSFDMHNNTIYKSGKDGSENYGWASILVNYAPTSTYNISNNIFCKPFNTANERLTIVVPAGSGTVTCKNNLVIDYPNFSKAPASGWDLANVYETTTNVFKDTLNRDFTLSTDFTHKGTDGNFLGDPRWWPGQGSSINEMAQLNVKTSFSNGFIRLESADIINSVEIYTLNGSRIMARSNKTNSMQLETNQFKKGIYLLKIASGNKLVAQKITVK